MYGSEHIARLHRMVHAGVSQWDLPPRTDVRLLTVSENATFLLTDPATGAHHVLRVHRPGYHTEAEIASELAWIEALRRDRVLSTPAPIAATDGTLIKVLSRGGEQRHAVLFEHVEGREPSPDESLTDWFRELGAITARMHRHAKSWRRPAGFTRKVWDFETSIGEAPHWGRWRDGLALDAQGAALIGRTAGVIRTRLARYGTPPERFGVVHADLRLANLLVSGRDLHVIDFDDCGLSWFLYDFAAAVSFIEHTPIVPALQEAWTNGYRGVAPLPPEDAAEIPVMVMLRRILLLAWIASHAETPTAQEMGEGFTAETLRLCEDFLSRG